MKKLARSLVTLSAAAGLALSAAGPALASAGGTSTRPPDPTPAGPACAQITLNPPLLVNGFIRWTGSATNCSTAPERIVLKGSDVTSLSTPGCTVAPLAYGLPSQAAGSTVYWYMTSKNQLCPGSHTEQYDAYADNAGVANASTTVTYVSS